MNKINNFKLYMNNYMETKYQLNKEEIASYWKNRRLRYKFICAKSNNITMGSLVTIAGGTSAFIANSSLTRLYMHERNIMNLISIGIIGVGVLVTAFSIASKNPYQSKNPIFKEIDKDYKKLEKNFNKEQKNVKKNS